MEEQLKSTQKKGMDILDLVKMILAFMVVAIHSGLFDPFLYPWLRLAVPLFFMISSYLFFKKINGCEHSKERNQALKDFVLRNLKLYAFWFIVLFPVSGILRGWFDMGGEDAVVNIIINFFIGSTFVASWFISALIIGVIVVFLARNTNKTALLVVGIVLYLLVSLRTSYMFVFKNWTDMLYAVATFEAYTFSPINSFPAGIPWIIFGKLFADGYFSKIKIKTSAITLGVSSVLLFAEWFLIMHFSGKYSKDFYIMLLPCCLAILNILLQLKPINLKYAKEMRKISVFVYASHGSLVHCLVFAFNRINLPLPSFVIYILTLVICVGAALLVFVLEKYKYLKWLRYSH